MAGLNDIKNDDDIVIDLTAPPKEQQKTSTNNTGNRKTVVSMNGDLRASMMKGRHTVVENTRQQSKNPRANMIKEEEDAINIDATGSSNKEDDEVVIDTTATKRVNVDINDIATGKNADDEYNDKYVSDDPVKDMLEGEDSIFGQYLKYKTEELSEQYENAIAEAELNSADDEIEGTNKEDDGLIRLDDYQPSYQGGNKVMVDDDDILSSLGDEDIEEEEEMAVTKDHNDEDLVFSDNTVVDDEEELIDDDANDVKDIDEVINEEDNTDDELEKEVEVVLSNEPVKEEKKIVEEPKKKKVAPLEMDVEVSKTTSKILEADIDSEDEEIKESDADELLKKLQKIATEKLKPVSQKLDLSSFTVLKKPTTGTKQLQAATTKAAKWVLFEQQGIVIMREFTGSELEKLRTYSEDSRSLSSITKRFRMIYDHIESAKPASFETWIKTTPYIDVEHLYFAIYIASFKGANYIPMDCSKCNETWLTEDIDIMDMVVFEDEEAKKKFSKIYQSEEAPMSASGLYVSEIVPLSDTIACAFKEPSIYNSFEIVTLDTEFRNKYSDIIPYIPYIDSLYFIDKENSQLTPIGYKIYENNNTKSTKSKIIQFAKVLNTLTVDEFYIVRSYMSAIDKKGAGVSYKIPECQCPNCGELHPENTNISSEEMLFTRYQLGTLVSMSLN